MFVFFPFVCFRYSISFINAFLLGPSALPVGKLFFLFVAPFLFILFLCFLFSFSRSSEFFSFVVKVCSFISFTVSLHNFVFRLLTLPFFFSLGPSAPSVPSVCDQGMFVFLPFVCFRFSISFINAFFFLSL